MNSISLMNAVSVRFDIPWLLFLIIPAAGLMLWPYFRLKKQNRRTVSRIVSLVLHSIVIVLCAFMVSGMKFDYSHAAVKSDVVILVDASDSTEPSRDRMNEFIRSVADACEDVRLGIVTFANGQVTAAELDGDVNKVYNEYIKNDKKPNGNATDIASALQYAAEMLPVPQTGRIILLSDGKQTDGNALAAVKSIADGGTRVDSVYFTPEGIGSEVQINNVEVPKTVNMGEAAQITVTVQSASASSGKLRLYDNGELYAEQTVDLPAGETACRFDYTLISPELHEFKVEIVPDSGDTFVQNNVYYSYVSLDSTKRVLIVDGSGNDSKNLESIIGETYDVDVCDTKSLPVTAEQLASYDEVILANVANADLPAGYGNILTDYVEIYGGGLYTVGGDRAYKEDDMKDTVFQELLPVTATTEARSLGLLLVIDNSSSMEANAQGSSSTRMELAIAAAKASVEALAPDDYIGVMTFDEDPQTIVGMTQITNKGTIIRQIDNIKVGWGTVYSKALKAARETLTSFRETELRHVIFLTDGDPVDGKDGHSGSVAEIYNEASRLAANGITVSTIALGPEAVDTSIAEEIAETCKGRFYSVVRESELSRVMVDETTVAMGKYENNEKFTPQIVSHTAAVSGITELPELGGFYGTRIKNGATTVLSTDSNPVYAEWKRGAGKVGSFMCDLNGTWSAAFLADPAGVRFIKNSVSSLFPAEKSDAYTDVRADFIRDNFSTEIRIYSETAVTVKVIAPSGETEDLELVSVTDNVYAGRFESVTSGVYTAEITKSGESSPSLRAHTAVSYSDEYRMFADDTSCFAFMETIATNGNGKVLFDTENMFGKKNEVVSGTFDPRLTFMIIALVLFLIDIVVRKFKIDRLIEIIREKSAAKKEKAK